jgi:hypothetical protein
MKSTWLARAAIAAALVVVCADGARAQTSEDVGIRAHGMGGAFTAVADDATAAWWNPAGLAAGAYFNAVIESATRRDPAADGVVPAWESSTRGFSIAYPALALSYYRLKVSEIEPVSSIGGAGPGRQDEGSSNVRLSSFVLNQFGVTVGQSLGNHLVVASTVKLMRGGVGLAVRQASGTTLDAAGDLDRQSEMHPGLDVGALSKFGPLRLGVMVRNAKEATFGEGGQAIELDRHVRAGVALISRSNLTTVAVDLDLTKTELPTGESRRFAAGAEAWGATRKIGIRGGVSVNTIGDARPSASGGVSAALRSGTFLDVAATAGSDETQRGWGFALRVTF